MWGFNRGRYASVPDRVSENWISYWNTHIMYCIIDYFKGWLLVIMIHSTVAVEDGHAFLFRPFTVTPIHAVIRPVVPLAGKDEETLWKKEKTPHTHKKKNTPSLIYYNRHCNPCTSVAIARCDDCGL